MRYNFVTFINSKKMLQNLTAYYYAMINYIIFCSYVCHVSDVCVMLCIEVHVEGLKLDVTMTERCIKRTSTVWTAKTLFFHL